MTELALPPLTVGGWFTTWHVDVGALLLAAVVTAGYLVVARRRTDWPLSRTLCFCGGVAAFVVVRSSYLAVYDHSLFWVLATQDILLLALIPLPLALGRPWELLSGGRRRLSLPPLVGSLLAVGTLLLIYVTPWDAARLEQPWLFRLTQLLLVAVGLAFLGPLLGEGPSGYGTRTLVAFADGLLDALPGLAVLAAHGVIASTWYDGHARTWGPSPLKDQQVGGTAMIALSELVGLPVLLVLLVQWVRADAGDAAAVDAELDAVATATAVESPVLEVPWWERDAGPLAGRLRRQGLEP